MDWTPNDGLERQPTRAKGSRRRSDRGGRLQEIPAEFHLEALEPRILLSASPLNAPQTTADSDTANASLLMTSITQDAEPVARASAAPDTSALPAVASITPSTPIYAAATSTLSGTVYDWSTHVKLSGVTVTITGASTASTITDDNGGYSFSGLSNGSYAVTASMPVGPLGHTITSSAALAAQRIAAGIDPNQLVGSTQSPLSPFELIAADVNGDGKVTSADVQGLLQEAVGSPTAPTPMWKFAAETDAFYNSATSSLTIDINSVPTTLSATQTVNGDTTVNLVGILAGDVTGKYVPYDDSGNPIANPPTVPVATIVATASANNVPNWIYGVSTTATVNLSAALANDTGTSAIDRITSDATVSGQANSTTPIVTLKGALDTTAAAGYATLTDTLDASGNFTLSAARLAALAGGTLADGVHTLHLTATDQNGNFSRFDLSFTLLTARPIIATLALSPASGSQADNTTSAASIALTGVASTGATITVGGQSGLAGAGGIFQIGGIAITDGANTLTAVVTDAAGNSSSKSVVVTKQGTLAADQTLVWNQAALNVIQHLVVYPEDATRVLGMVALAQYDTLAAIQDTPAYLVSRTVTGPVAIDVALAEAADTVLSLLFPSQKAAFDALLATVTGAAAEGAAKTAALALGADIGTTIYNIRANDGSATFIDYTGSTVTGKWRPTGPAYLVAEDPQWGNVTPFALTSGSEFRPAPPPDLTSATYAADLNEVQSLGSATSTTRTADQTQIALFWNDGRGSVTPPGHWVAIAEQVALAKGNSLADNVRLFAKLDVALADSAIAAWDAKYTYGTWRPDTAIHNADQDNNAATTADPNWTPLIIDPAHPDYVSGHSTFSEAAATVLADAFGDNTSFTIGSTSLAGVTRSYTSFSQAAAEAGRSRIYAGIHTQSANAAGAALGAQVANAVLTRFSLSLDTQPPTVVLPATAAVVNANPTFAGSIIDNISGVASATVSIDGGAFTALTLDASGHFSITTSFATDGTADGAHSIAISTTDVAGNVAPVFTRAFTLDTKLPVVTVTSLADNDTLSAASRLTGAADPTGSNLISLTLAIDGGRAAPVAFDNATGAFDQALPIANLAIGTHSLVLTATDAAGNVGTLTRPVTVQALAAFTVTNVTPAAGSSDVGSTQRPQVFFSRAVNAATLTASSLYATGPDGSVLPTTIVPAADGSFAWLFFTNPMPGGATVTIHVVGSAIRAAADGAFLDAGATGVAGSTDTVSFTTVSLAPVTGTKLVGRVVDPGPDDVPMTLDDVKRGPDGILNTPDDVYLLPIANAKVTILGTNQVVYTDANGLFELDDIPTGTVKVSIDGRTATNPPTGFFFPEMVMSADIQAGVTNTLMGTVGSDDSKASNAGLLDVYLPRVSSSSLTAVSDTATTVITANQASAPKLTTDQVASLSLTIPPGSAVGADGKPLTNVQIGIATVPAELVKDMLPAGVLQHTFDITIQAPGVSTFTTPVQITFPNVFNAAPGTKLNVLSFDHTTGMLVIDGTATVSADGKTVVSDPDGGVKAPGWHGLTSPGSQTSGPSVGPDTPTDPTQPPAPPPMPPCSSELTIKQYAALAGIAADVAKCGAALVGVDFQAIYKTLGDLATIEQQGAKFVDQVKNAYNDYSAYLKDPVHHPLSAGFLDTISALVAGKTGIVTAVKDLGQNLTGEVNLVKKITACASSVVDALANAIDLYQGDPSCPKNEAVNAFLDKIKPYVAEVKSLLTEIDNAVDAATKGTVEAAEDFALKTVCDWTDTIVGIMRDNIDKKAVSVASGALAVVSVSPVSASTSPADDLDVAFAEFQASYSVFSGNLSDTASSTTDVASMWASDGKLLAAAGGYLGVMQQFFTGLPTDAPYSVSYGNVVLRGNTDANGAVSAFLPANTQFTLNVLDNRYDTLGTFYGVTGASGSQLKLGAPSYQPFQSLEDTDGDGLPDAAEFVFGTNPTKVSTAGDGISDYTRFHDALGPVATQLTATGIVAAVALNGLSQQVEIVSSPTGQNMLTAYVATGAAGLAIVDVSMFAKPAVQSQLALPGSATGIAVDTTRNLAAVADGASGLQIVDVSTATAPKVTQTVVLPNSATRVALQDGIAYVANGTSVSTVDIETGEVLQNYNIGGSTLTDLAISNGTLFTLDISHVLRATTITGQVYTARGSIALSAAYGTITVDKTTIYVGAYNGFSGGYETVDATNLDRLALLSGVDANNLGGGPMALNGSGLGLALAPLRGPQGQAVNGLDLVNVADPTDTSKFITRITLPASPNDVAIANGIAFVADGTSGLQIVNYLGFDTKGVAPTVSIATDAIDVDSNTAGVQVVEGTTINVTPTVADDVQVRNVQMLVNGQVVANDPSYPFDFAIAVPTIASGGSTLTLQVQATDTGGNTTLSAPITLSVVRDTFPPTVAATSVSENARLFFVRSVQVTFNKPIDTTRIAASGITLTNEGADATLGTADDFKVTFTTDTRSGGQVLSVIPSAYLAPGNYQLRIDPSVIFDRAGNQLAAPVTLDFTIRPASDIRAASGTPAVATAPSANPGQTIGLPVPFDPTTAVATFTIIDASGTQSTRDVTVTRADTIKGVAYFTVPADANTGDVVVYSLVGATKTNFADGTFYLQILPTVTAVTVQSVSSDGTTASVLLTGSGFIEGSGTYTFGSAAVVDTSVSAGPDVSASYVNGYIANGSVTLTVPLSDGAFGPIVVTSAGGSSAAYVASLSSITSAALSGTPADATQASANPGQAITLNGANLSTSTAVLFHYTDQYGAARVVSLTPTAAAANGNSATLVLPSNANGVGKLQVFGSSSEPLLQIVPVVTGFSASGTSSLTLTGAGFVEAASTYNLPGATIVDTQASAGPDVTYAYPTYVENGTVNIPVTAYGAGGVSVATAGGASAALALNAVNPGLGALRDVAVDPASGAVWVVDAASPGRLDHVDPATGAVLNSITLSDAAEGSAQTYYGDGLQIVPSAFTLGATSVPAGSLLLFHASPSPDRVVAINPANGNVVASLALAADYSTTGGVYDKTTGHLFLIDRRASTTAVVEINPATGALISSFNLPFNVSSEGGLAVNPTTGNLWYASDTSANAVELSKTGTVLRTVSLALLGVPPNTATGLAFDASGSTLFVSTSQGLVYKVSPALDPAAQTYATLTAVSALATDGTPANGAQASANVGQVITLTGSNFNAATEVLFTTRDNNGNLGLTNQAPLAINAAGTQLQVVVPNLAATGNVQVVNTGAQNLGFGGANDAIYRKISLTYTPAAANSVVTFADLGLAGINYESWGIDNVGVAQNGATVFSDNFEGGAKSNWSSPTTDATLPGVFTQFSGRFSSGSQALSLTGLTPGQAVTLTFDLYVLDGWNGGNASAGPDVFQVSADGATLMSNTFTNNPSYSNTSTQSFGASAGIKLQIVPTLTATGQPGGDGSFTLTGSGFQEGASTITVGGVSFVDSLTGLPQFAVSGVKNGAFTVDAPLTLDGPVKVTTDGGSATIAGPVIAAQPPTLFTAIQASATAGAAADTTKPSANVGQTITLIGQGFTSSTLVQFAGIDDTGAAGTITRTGTVGGNGTTLTVTVPELARTGAVTVLGSGASLTLQVVPLLRGVGGAVIAGNQVLLDGTGLVGAELTVLVDGRAAGTFTVRSIADIFTNSSYYYITPAIEQGQQLLSLTLPAGVTAGVITVSTAGGSFTLHSGATIAANALTPAADVGDTLTAAQTLTLAPDSRITVSAKIGDGAVAAGLDVDLYKVTLAAGDQLAINASGASYTYLRVLNASGAELANKYFNPSGTAALVFAAPASGTYYVGVSGYGNTAYNPATSGSGVSSGYTGAYQLQLERLGGGDSRISGITASATYGTPAQSAVASANVGQTITLTGAGFATGETVLFSAIDANGYRHWSTATAASVAADGSSLTVVVPIDATTGAVRLARDPAGVVLQIVPHLTHIDASAGQAYNGGYLTVTGSGFAEGATTILFGATALNDSSRSDGLDVATPNATTGLNTISLTVPAGVPTGPIRVTTIGGVSDLAGPAFTGITATASSGAPAVTATPSAVPGQTITITGTGFDAATEIVFQTIDAYGNRSQVLVQPATVRADGASATVVVPLAAVSGAVRIVGDQNATSAMLQILPVITGLTVQSVSSDGTSASILLTGSGFIEGAATYTFGSTVIPDTSLSHGPDVSASYVNGYIANGSVTLTVPLSDGAFGPIVVTSAGGSSAAYVASLSSITSVALSGTPADATQASANPGQAITLNGSNLSTSTAVLFHYTDQYGSARVVILTPTAAAANGASATLVLPTNANGVGKLQVFGSSSEPLLQIVPVVTGFTASGTSSLTLTGAGFVEAAGTYNLPGATIVDTQASAGPDVTYAYPTYVENGTVNIPVTAYGAGSVSVTTAGGASAALALNAVNPGLGALRDVAVDPASGAVWVVDAASPGRLDHVDPATGAVLNSITLSDAAEGSAQTYYGDGLQIVPSAFTLGATSVPAGSLLLFHASPSPDRVVAINPANGNVVASLALAADYSTTGGVYDKTTGHLFLIDRRASTTAVVEINPATGALISSFNLPFNVSSEGGLAVNPTTGNLWYASDTSANAVELSKTGTVLRTVSLALLGVPANTATGLAFDAAGSTLFVSTSQGLVYKVSLALDPAAQTYATLTAVSALATDGTPANGAQASANVGQVITLTGSNFNAATEVLFTTRDNNGNLGLTNQAPLAINAAGTQLQVVVPNLAATGNVQVVNTGSQNLGFGGNNDAIYHKIVLTYTPAAANSVVTFADLGLAGINYESWGIDNVGVAQNGATVFSDNFEGGAKPNWSSPTTDATLPGVFSQFSGRFSSGSQALSLTGLTPGQAVTLTFDLYVLDGWNGGNASAGPDVFQVSADGATLMSNTFTNNPSYSNTSTQSFGASAGIKLQIVPTLTATGQPGGDGSFTLTGSGFQEGASTITVGGVSFVDSLTGLPQFAVSGVKNGAFTVDAPLTLDGPVKVTTDGGSATIAGPVIAAQPPTLFTAIQASATAGAATDTTKPSANVGQTITLIGQGFTSSTLVQFAGIDDTGAAGTITRTGTVGGNGTMLTVTVPELARTGAVTVLGSGASLTLQVVPLLRGVGGTVVAGNQVLLDGTGLVGAELTVLVDGRAAGTFTVRSIADISTNSSYYYSAAAIEQGQQLLSLTLPAGVTAGVITVSTAGGSFTLHSGATIAASALTPAADVGDTLTAAQTLTLAPDSRITVSAKIGDGSVAAGLDVDLYKITLAAGDQLAVNASGASYTYLRVLNASGAELANKYFNPSGTAALVFTAPASGTYYVGVSGYGNTAYNPATAGSGVSSGYTGAYQLQLERLGGGDSRISGITASATYGTPAQSAVASANVGQTITLTGAGFATGETVLFSAIDANGYRHWSTATAASVAADGSSLTVVVPIDATTGAVRLARDPAGVVLQIVPHLTHIDASAGQAYNGGYLTVTGSGFAEGATTILFGATALNDSSRSDGLDVATPNATTGLNTISLTVPAGVPTGPIRVTTIGGVSDLAGPAFTGITATASSGAPAVTATPSAVPGQTITITGTGFDAATEIVFQTIDAYGNRSQVLVQPATVRADGASATVVVPLAAVSGAVRIVGDQNATSAMLQILPVITGLTVQSVSSDGTSASILLTGSGFIEGAATYTFGSTVIPDTSLSHGPDVSASYVNGYIANGSVTLTVPLSDGAFGPIVVTSAGGSSAAYVASLSSITSVALSGTPADATQASANPGQAITLNGSNLSTSTAVLFHYTDQYGSARVVILTPTAAAANGASATLVLPTNANGVGKLQVFGSSSEPLLQIVPVVTGFTASGTSSLTLTGAGFVEAAGTYNLPGATIVDTQASAGPDVFYGYPTYVENGTVNIPVTAYGAGSVSVTTAGGASAALALNAVNPGLGALRDVAVDPASGAVWVVDAASPGRLDHVDPATGAVLNSITLSDAAEGSAQTYYGDGLQIVPSAFTLGATSVPAGSLLLFHASPSPDRVVAINPANGNVVASLALAADYSTTGGVYDKTTGHLFLIDRRASTTAVVEINPATGALISSFNLPFNVSSEGGLAVNPTTGNLWYASDTSANAVELSKTGTVLRTVSLALLGVPANTATGLAFDAAGSTLFVSTSQGLVYKASI